MKVKILVVLIILALGMTLGINFARGKPLLSNPFAEKTFSEKARDAVDGLFK